MKILFLSNRDLASNVALNLLLPALSKNNEIHLWLSAKVGKNNALPKQLRMLKFFEQDLFNKLLGRLIPATKNTNRYNVFEEFSASLSSEIREVNQINSPGVIADLKQLSPDLVVSIRYGGILREEFIAVPKHSVINLHSGILPKYKGVMATFWALKNNDSQVGTTLHTIEDASIDTGHIVKISKMKVNVDQSYLWHVLQLYKQGTADVLEAVETIRNGDLLDTHPQDESHTYFTFPNEKECHEFEQGGHQIVDEQEYMDFIHLHYMD